MNLENGNNLTVAYLAHHLLCAFMFNELSIHSKVWAFTIAEITSISTIAEKKVYKLFFYVFLQWLIKRK